MSGHLLIVDDEIEIREMLARHYRLKQHDVALAADAQEALAMLAQRRFDVVISDIKMPGMNGVDLLKEIRTEYPMTRVIMITGYVTLDHALACLRRGADTCVFKPLTDLGELDEAVDSAISWLRRWQAKLVELRGMKPARMEAWHE